MNYAINYLCSVRISFLFIEKFASPKLCQDAFVEFISVERKFLSNIGLLSQHLPDVGGYSEPYAEYLGNNELKKG